MTIKARLSFLTISMMFAMVLIIGINFFTGQVVDNMLNEERTVYELKDLILKQNIELGRLLNSKIPIIEQLENYKEIALVTENAFISIGDLKVVPTLNEKTIKAFDSISKINAIVTDAQSKLYSKIGSLIKILDSSDNDFTISGLDSYKQNSNYKIYFAFSKNITTAAFNVDIGLATAARIVSDQSEIIGTTVKHYKQLSFYISIGIVLFIIIVLFFVSKTISGKITKSIKLLTESLSVMISGDFSKKIEITSKDELGELGKELNKFQTDLNSSLNRIKKSSVENEAANGKLIESTTTSSSAVIQISANIKSINNQMSLLDRNIANSTQEVQGITSFTSELNNYSNNQMNMVEESTSAITQMIASISSITEFTSNSAKVASSLESTAIEGDRKLTETTDLID